MKVQTNQPFKIIYSLLEHQYLGFSIQPFVVQINSKGEMTMQLQQVSSKNVREFSAGIDQTDIELVTLTDALHQDAIIRKYNQKKIAVFDFFHKTFEGSQPELKDQILTFVENIRGQIMDKIQGKDLYLMSSDGIPTWKPLTIPASKAKVYFHFIRQDDGSTHYFPIIRHDGDRVVISHQKARLICDEPAWLLKGQTVYHFENKIDGKKLKPFFNKFQIVIPANLEETYYKKFVVGLIAGFDVFAKGFDIQTASHMARPVLMLSEPPTTTQNLFGQSEDSLKDGSVFFELFFGYGEHLYRFDSFATPANVSLSKQNDTWVFNKIKRDLTTERQILAALKDQQLDLRLGKIKLDRYKALDWVHHHLNFLEENQIEIRQSAGNKYFIGAADIDIKIQENKDWFDVHAIVTFGEFEIPFYKLKNNILSKKKEFVLPNGQIAILPDYWFSKYADLYAFSEEKNGQIVLGKHHLTLVQNLESEGLAATIIDRKLNQLVNFSKIDPVPLPKGFQGTLRPYQKSGFDWLCFLDQYNLGGCLADDMGLGKTVQALAFLQRQIELKPGVPNLIILPTSLLYNWVNELQKFTPMLRFYIYTGTHRNKDIAYFAQFDIIFTTYGTVRLDIENLRKFRFNYAILDESQAIKNPSSATTRALMTLNTANRLVLTGTPLENSTVDLWSQMTFANPGLLGSLAYFRSEYQIPIEKNQDSDKSKKMFGLIKPFMMRRHKSQVAKDLPPKVENIIYCEMTPAQEKVYEEEKSYYRNIILDAIEDDGINKSQIVLLQGLTKLRQISNHPRMVSPSYEDDSGKFEEIKERIVSIVETKHKVLIFSQFTRHLELFTNWLKQENLPFCYLDGATSSKERAAQVDRFQTDPNIHLFLMSIKAGGVGLNLTAAEYVFVLDPWWNPAVEAQAIDRAHRIGQKNTVFSYKFITKNTVEEKILTLQNSKKQLFNNVVVAEESFVKNLTKEDILALLD